MDYLPWLTPAPHDDPLVAAIREQCMGVGAHDATAHGILDLIEDSGHGYGATATECRRTAAARQARRRPLALAGRQRSRCR